jgi:4-diphosphocytidyl-2-C-methyl-D-erythritol kinase
MALRSLHDLPAPAKLNLFLHVVGRRADGYHLLQSLFVLIDWADTLHFELRHDGKLQRHDLGPALPEDDLCLRAARALQRASGSTLGVDISVLKSLPWGAGLGGGSSDAATTLLALNRLWGLGWPQGRLAALALTLGADVPFFVHGCNALVEGIGDRMRPVTVPVGWYAVIKPQASIATRDIFGHPALVRNTDPAIVAGCFESGEIQSFSSEEGTEQGAGQGERGLSSSTVPESWLEGFGRNDLQPVAEGLCSEVAQASLWLESRFGNSRMSGSGSAVFSRAGMGESPTVPLVASELAPGWSGRMCRSLARHPLAGWADSEGF